MPFGGHRLGAIVRATGLDPHAACRGTEEFVESPEACAQATAVRLTAVPPGQNPLVPKIFNASRQARGGDIITIQGANLDSSTLAYQDGGGAASVPLKIVDRVKDIWIAVQLPTNLTAPTIIRLKNSHGVSDPLRLNAARPHHLDATRLVPGGPFRLFGLDLRVSGATPSITINGQIAPIDLRTSTDTMLVATVPPTVSASGNAEILSDNGNGTGPTRLAVVVPIVPGSGDPLGLGVGWAAGFTFSRHVVPAKAACNSKTDDTWSIQAAVFQAVKDGGGIVQLPAGQCRLMGTVNLGSKVVLRGAGQNATILRYEGNYPIYAENFDLVGLQDLQLLNAGPVQEGLIWKSNTRSVIQRVAFEMAVSRQMFLTSNRDFVFDGNLIEQTGSYDQQNPYRFDFSSGLVFSNNHSINVAGSPTFQYVHDAVFMGNRFTRNAISQFQTPIVAHHGFVIDFSYRISILSNLFDVANGPIMNRLRNDGETILVEGGGAFRTENVGTVLSATPDTLTDPRNRINVNPFGTGIPQNYAVVIVSGPGIGQVRRVVRYTGWTLAIDHPWDVVPDGRSRYSTFVWALQDAIIQGNILRDNPRGIWLYQSSIDNVTIASNQISQGGGVFLRSYQNLADKMLTVQIDTVIRDNIVMNSTGRWMSYVGIANVDVDPAPFGTGEIGIEVRRNRLIANRPNVVSKTEDYASWEGFSALVHNERTGSQSNATDSLLGTVFQGNVCQSCDRPYVTDSGDHDTVIAR